MEDDIAEFCNAFSPMQTKLKSNSINSIIAQKQKVSICKLKIYELADFSNFFLYYFFNN